MTTTTNKASIQAMVDSGKMAQVDADVLIAGLPVRITPVRVAVGPSATISMYGVTSGKFPLTIYLNQLVRLLGIDGEVDTSKKAGLAGRLAKAIAKHDYSVDTTSPLALVFQLCEASHDLLSQGQGHTIKASYLDSDGKVLEDLRKNSAIKPS